MANLFEAILAINSKDRQLEEERMEEAFEVFSMYDNGQRANIPTTDTFGKSKYSDAASAEMQKAKLEKENPGKKWSIIQVEDKKKQNFQRTAKQQATGDKARLKEQFEILEESVIEEVSKHTNHLDKASKTSDKNEYHQHMINHHLEMSKHHADRVKNLSGKGKEEAKAYNLALHTHHSALANHHNDMIKKTFKRFE